MRAADSVCMTATIVSFLAIVNSLSGWPSTRHSSRPRCDLNSGADADQQIPRVAHGGEQQEETLHAQRAVLAAHPGHEAADDQHAADRAQPDKVPANR